MEEFNTERKSSELNKEEVNVYTDDCGVTRYNCVTDCFWVLFEKIKSSSLSLIYRYELKNELKGEINYESIGSKKYKKILWKGA